MPGRKDICGFGTSFDAKRWLSLDPCGCMGISLSWGVHLYALSVLAVKVIPSSVASTTIYYMFYVPVAILAMVSLFRASTTDPGAVPLGAQPFTVVKRAVSGELTPTRGRSIRRCHKCNDNYKPARAHHDSVTGRCIVKFDHFCPWVNNSIGALNHKHFFLFLFYTAISCLISLLLLLIRMVHCGYVKEEEDDKSSTIVIDTEGTRLLTTSSYVYPECKEFVGDHLVIGLVIASFVFLIFSISMGCEQLEAIETGKGKIARMQQSVGKAGTELSKVTEEFNEMFGGNSPNVSWHWYVPIPVRFPRGMQKVVLGYEFNETCLPVPYQEPGTTSPEKMEAGLNVVTEPPSPPVSESDGLFRGASDASVKNRRSNSRTSDENEEGLTLVERTKARLI